MRTTDSIAKLAEALAAAQGEFINPERNRTVEVLMKNDKGKYSFTYATFDAICEMTRPILSKHGLSVIQPPSVGDAELIVTTRLMHASGEWIEEVFAITTASADPQALGSLLTYMKRYSYCSMLGITAEEDDDGNAATGNEIGSSKNKEPMPTCPKCEKSSGVIKGKEEFGGGWVCFNKKGGCGHKWHDAPAAEPPKTNGKKPADQPPGDPHESSKSAVRNCEKERFGTLIDQIAAGTRSTPEQKDELLELLAQRVVKSADEGNEQIVVDALMAKISAVRKEQSHTFAS